MELRIIHNLMGVQGGFSWYCRHAVFRRAIAVAQMMYEVARRSYCPFVWVRAVELFNEKLSDVIFRELPDTSTVIIRI